MLVRLEHDRQLHTYYVAKAKAENQGSVMAAEGELQEKNAALEEMNMKYRRRQVSAAQVSQIQGQVKAARGRLEIARMNAELAELELRLAEKLLERRFVRCALKEPWSKSRVHPVTGLGEGEIVVSSCRSELDDGAHSHDQGVRRRFGGKCGFSCGWPEARSTRVAQVIGMTPMQHGTEGRTNGAGRFANADPFSLVSQKAYEILLPQNLKTAPIAKQVPAPPKPPETSQKPPGRT